MQIKANTHSEEHAFRDASVAFAVDVSGSTAGQILSAEKNFIRRIASLLSPQAQSDATVIPWDSYTKEVRSIALLNTLISNGCTRPVYIAKNNASRLALKKSSVWFLMTDGMIYDSDRQMFANELAEQGLHGLSCVSVIFGSSFGKLPINCNISVGISVYAAVPNCLFLYYDIMSGAIFILSAKGIFKRVLGAAPCPVINYNTRWEHLPPLNINELASVMLPPVRELSKDDLALQGDVVVNLEDLWSNKLAPETVTNILSNEENLSSVLQTAQCRNQTGRFQSWIQQQQINVLSPVDESRHDLNNDAESNFRDLIALLKSGHMPSEQMRQRLRNAYAANMTHINKAYNEQFRRANERALLIQASQIQSKSSTSSLMALQSPQQQVMQQQQQQQIAHNGAVHGQAPVFTPPTSLYSLPYRPAPTLTFPDAVRMNSTVAMQPQFPTPTTSNLPVPSNMESVDLLYTRGFQKRSGSFRGSCSICGAQNETLAWLFHIMPASAQTNQAPGLTMSSIPDFPLATGTYPEADVLCTEICCDACSNFCVKTKSSLSSDSIIGALPMVTFTENGSAYSRVLNEVFGGRFDLRYLPQIFLSALLSKIPCGFNEQNIDVKTKVFRQAVTWVSRDIMFSSAAFLGAVLNPGNSEGPSQPLGTTIREQIQTMFQQTNDSKSILTRYPLGGLLVALRAAHIIDIDIQIRRRAMFRRFLYLLIETIMTKGIQKQALKDYLMNDPSNLFNAPMPVLTLPISTLRGSPLLDEDMYQKLALIEEFKFLENEGVAWCGPATATFLHALVRMLEGASLDGDMQELFNNTVNLQGYDVIASRPEAYSIEESSQIIPKLL
jgi:hypothetical protein